MNDAEIAIIKKSLKTEEELTVFRLLLDAEKRDDPGMVMLYSLCLTCLVIPELIPTVTMSLIPLGMSLQSVMDSAMNNPNQSRRN